MHKSRLNNNEICIKINNMYQYCRKLYFQDTILRNKALGHDKNHILKYQIYLFY